jgi:dTDP-4-dehydrorhamnose reductase
VRTLVLGAGGRLGRRLATAHGVTGLGRHECDIAAPAQLVRVLDHHRPDVVINAGAYTDVDGAERDTATAWLVNGRAPGMLAWACRDRGIRCVHISTDYVLAPILVSADEAHACEPRGTYAASKRAGEVAALEAGALVVRVQWLYARGDGGFVDRALRDLRAGKRVRASMDQVGVPTPVGAVVGPILDLAAAAPAGVWHVAPHGFATPEQWVRAACSAVEVDARRLDACTAAELAPRAAPRPHWSVMDATRAERFLGRPMPHWVDALQAELIPGSRKK